MNALLYPTRAYVHLSTRTVEDFGDRLDRLDRLWDRLQTITADTDSRIADLRTIQERDSMLWTDAREAALLERRLTAVLAIMEQPL